MLLSTGKHSNQGNIWIKWLKSQKTNKTMNILDIFDVKSVVSDNSRMFTHFTIRFVSSNSLIN